MRGVEGTVKVNGQDRSKDHRNELSRLSCYIMQDDALRPALTVKEAMTFAAHLKLGYSTSHKKKQRQVREHRVAEMRKQNLRNETVILDTAHPLQFLYLPKHNVRKLDPLSS
jgi:ABC-type multidrug transport system ATPase subunit